MQTGEVGGGGQRGQHPRAVAGGRERERAGHVIAVEQVASGVQLHDRVRVDGRRTAVPDGVRDPDLAGTDGDRDGRAADRPSRLGRTAGGVQFDQPPWLWWTAGDGRGSQGEPQMRAAHCDRERLTRLGEPAADGDPGRTAGRRAGGRGQAAGGRPGRGGPAAGAAGQAADGKDKDEGGQQRGGAVPPRCRGTRSRAGLLAVYR